MKIGGNLILSFDKMYVHTHTTGDRMDCYMETFKRQSEEWFPASKEADNRMLDTWRQNGLVHGDFRENGLIHGDRRQNGLVHGDRRQNGLVHGD